MKTWELGPKLKPENLVKTLLASRGLKTQKQQKEFLRPESPEKLTAKEVGIDERQLQLAVKRIKQAIKNQEAIVVYGDYDADGICSTAILWEALYQTGAKAMPFVPLREEHGYGLSIKGIEAMIKDNQPKLIITVDNGIVANKPVEYANGLGMEVIVTDHHQVGKQLPKALAIIHTTKLAGAGVALMVAKAINPEAASKAIDLTALATVADMVPLVGANRQIVKHGLEQLRQTKRPGLAAIFNEAQIEAETIDTYTINFVIAPRLNATGRVSQALDAVRLVCTKRLDKALELAQKLGEVNRSRQKLLEEQLEHARALVRPQVKTERILIVQHASYHQGIIGLIAGKLTEEFYRPSIVLSVNQDVAKASARSIPGFDVIGAIREAQELVMEAGGHPMAAGFSVATDKIEALTQKLRVIAAEKIDEVMLTPKLMIEAEVRPEDVNENLWQTLEQLEPFGMGNHRPTLALMGMTIAEIKLVGSEGKHIKMQLKELPGVEVMGFNLGWRLAELVPETKVDVAFSIDKNVWQGRESLQLKLKDVRQAKN